MPEAFDMSQVMDSDLDVSANWGRAYATKGERRYLLFMAKNVEATANIGTREVKKIGTNVIGHKAELVSYSVKLTIYKCTEAFDDILEDYVKTGKIDRIDIQISNEDPQCSDQIGRTSKVFNRCIPNGDMLLALLNMEGGTIEQEVEFLAESMTRPEKFNDPSGM